MPPCLRILFATHLAVGAAAVTGDMGGMGGMGDGDRVRPPTKDTPRGWSLVPNAPLADPFQEDRIKTEELAGNKISLC